MAVEGTSRVEKNVFIEVRGCRYSCYTTWVRRHGVPPVTCPAATPRPGQRSLELAVKEMEGEHRINVSSDVQRQDRETQVARLPDWARWYPRQSVKAGEFCGTVAGQLLAQCSMEEQYSPNLLLAVLWASLANTLPAAFWAVAFLLLPDQDGWRQAVVSSCTPALPTGAGLPEAATCTGPAADELIVQVPGSRPAYCLVSAANPLSTCSTSRCVSPPAVHPVSLHLRYIPCVFSTCGTLLVSFPPVVHSSTLHLPCNPLSPFQPALFEDALHQPLPFPPCFGG